MWAQIWAAVAAVDGSLADDDEAQRTRALVGQVYTNDDGSVDAVHLLHDLRLWPGVEESEHWNALAEDLRAKLCEGAAGAGIKTKEALCALFADDEGHPKKMRVDEFVEVCRESLGVDVAAPDDDEDGDDGEDPGQGELVAFVRCFVVEDGGHVDVGELLWKLLLWPGSEEEHRSLVAGRSLRQDLLTTAEDQGLETVGDLCASLMGRCHQLLTGDAPDDHLAKEVPVPALLTVLTESFGVEETADLTMYLQHFATPESKAALEAGEADAQPVVDLEKLLQHLELFDHDAADDGGGDDDDDADTVDAADVN